MCLLLDRLLLSLVGYPSTGLLNRLWSRTQFPGGRVVGSGAGMGIRRDEHEMRRPDAAIEMTADPESRLRQLSEQIAAHRRRHRELASRLARLAGQIADAEDRIAQQAERSARQNPLRADEHGRRAKRAREYSAYERNQQRRWAAVAAETSGR